MSDNEAQENRISVELFLGWEERATRDGRTVGRGAVDLSRPDMELGQLTYQPREPKVPIVLHAHPDAAMYPHIIGYVTELVRTEQTRRMPNLVQVWRLTARGYVFPQHFTDRDHGPYPVSMGLAIEPGQITTTGESVLRIHKGTLREVVLHTDSRADVDLWDEPADAPRMWFTNPEAAPA